MFVEKILHDGDAAIAKLEAEKRKEYDASIMKWRGISFDEYFSLVYSSNQVDLFAIGAELWFIKDGVCRCSKVLKSEIYIHKGAKRVFYTFEQNAVRLESHYVFASKDELDEHLRLGIVNPQGYGKGYGASNYRTNLEVLSRAGYSIQEFVLLPLGKKYWFIYKNNCICLPIESIQIISDSDGSCTTYGFSFTLDSLMCETEIRFFEEGQLFVSQEELLESM